MRGRVMALATAFAALASIASAQFVPEMEGRAVTLQNRILCRTADDIPAFFDLALQMEGLGVVTALAAANRSGIHCGIGSGVVVYRGAQEPFVFETEHGALRVTVHEFETQDGPVFGWSTDATGDGA